ncbi:MAG: hypothetical protein K6E12_08030 [Saccharofermentans sp.]|nr:hypothetical protein [Saccharofermentans sp.]
MYYMIVKSSSVYSTIEYYARCNEYGRGKTGEIVWTTQLCQALVLENADSINKVLEKARERSDCGMRVFSRFC